MSQTKLQSIIETLIFISGRTVGTSEILEALKGVPDGPQATKKELEEALEELVRDWENREGGIRLCRIAEGYEFRSAPEMSPWIKQLNKPKPQRLSVPAVETLALIAYRQPMTRADIESIRGVDSGGVLKSLGDRRLIKIVGRKEEAGRPLLYATTTEFLEFFGLKDLSEMPPLKEFEEMVKSQASEESGGGLEFSVTDLLSSSSELEMVDEQDREALDQLDASLKSLRQKEKDAEAHVVTSQEAQASSTAPALPEEDPSPKIP